MRAHAPALRFLRLGALLLLVASLIARPVVEQLGGMHAVEHAALAAADFGHGHDHDDHDPAGEPDHATGVHGLMHQADAGAAATLWPAWSLVVIIPAHSAPPLPETAAPRFGVPATPFRPPIA